ncbi:MAG: hypothetical protein ACK5NN_01070 [Sphingomonadaceae bacterium]
MKNVMFIGAAAIVALAGNSAAAQTAPSNATYVNPANPGNVGTASSTEVADFTITGQVDQACVMGAGGDLNDIDFGTIGIYADATSTVENVFTAVGPANGHTRTNLAGCNTSNTMTITKTNGADGLVNSGNTGGYDTNVFQNNIPYRVRGMFTGGDVGSAAPGTAFRTVQVNYDQASNSRANAAWKSNASFRIDLEDPAKALIAGTYQDTVTVTLAAL